MKEVVGEQKKALKGNQRDLDKDLLNLDRQEKQISLEIKKLAKAGQMTAAKQLAKEVVRIRTQRTKIYSMKGKLSGVQAHTTSMQANQTVMKSMVTATKAVSVSNQALPLRAVQQTAMQYQRQAEMAEMKQEMMDDVLDDGEEEEANAEVDQVLDSIGLNLSEQMSHARVGGSTPEAQSKEKERDNEVERLLAGLQ